MTKELDRTVVFGIPLKARVNAVRWDQVQDNLLRTLASIAAQTDTRHHTFVCGHDRPESVAFDAAVSWIPAEWAPPEQPARFSNDKSRKRRWILRTIRPAISEGIYYFLLDADDLISPDLVAHVLASDNRRGYLVEKGYIYDVQNDVLGRLSRKNRPFFKACGSCAAFWLTAADMPVSLQDKKAFFATLNDHTHYDEACAAANRPLEALPFYAAMYLLNHGNNNTQQKGTNEGKTRLARNTSKMKSQERAVILSRFGIRALQGAPHAYPEV
jgi:hypothetical protein